MYMYIPISCCYAYEKGTCIIMSCMWPVVVLDAIFMYRTVCHSISIIQQYYFRALIQTGHHVLSGKQPPSSTRYDICACTCVCTCTCTICLWHWKCHHVTSLSCIAMQKIIWTSFMHVCCSFCFYTCTAMWQVINVHVGHVPQLYMIAVHKIPSICSTRVH
jgi:hypothetical protein